LPGHPSLTSVADMKFLSSICIFTALFLAQCAFAQTGTQPRERRGVPPAPDQAAVDRGQKVFVENCGFCHGKDTNGGDGGPDLIRSVLVNHDEKGEQIGPVILNGRSDKGMPKFNLTPAQVSDVATFIHARVRSIRYRELYQVKELAGNPKAGEEYFNQKGHCNTCHSPTGDLTHIASKYEPEALLRRFLYPARPRAQTTVTVTLTSGQSFSGPLKHLDEFTVSMHDESGDYHTWNQEGLNVAVHDPLAAHIELLQRYTDDEMHDVAAFLETLK
jgi:cytochrome c oxidase cbb3-type subunit III